MTHISVTAVKRVKTSGRPPVIWLCCKCLHEGKPGAWSMLFNSERNYSGSNETRKVELATFLNQPPCF
jgi:ribosomal protein L37AE/L43A